LPAGRGLEQALAITDREFGRDHAQAAALLSSLGEALARLKQPQAALQYLERAM
jgi:hypothetical protein